MKYLQQRLTPPFRADIIGDLFKPERLKKAQSDYFAGTISATELENIENEEIEKLVSKIYDIGIDTVTDGGFRNQCSHLKFFQYLEGVGRELHEHHNTTNNDSSPICLYGKIKYNPTHPILRHFNFLRSITPFGMTTRQVLPTPSQLFTELSKNEAGLSLIYHNQEELIQDIASAYNETLQALYDTGCRNIMLETADCDSMELCLRLNSMAIENLPSDLVITAAIHHSPEATDKEYARFVTSTFGIRNINAYYLIFDNRHDIDFSFLQEIPDNKLAVLGLISGNSKEMESKDNVIHEIEKATQYIPLEQLCLCTHLTTGQNDEISSEERQWEKVKLTQEISEAVW